MTDCKHEHTKCMDCMRDLTGGESHLTPISSLEMLPAVRRIKELEAQVFELELKVKRLTPKYTASSLQGWPRSLLTGHQHD